MKLLIKVSINIGTNKIDWLRTIYFSLFGSAALTFAMKWGSFDAWPLSFFIIGIVLFLFGLLASMRISDSFKEYEKEFPKLDSAIKSKYSNEIDKYIIEKESKIFKGLQHQFIYTFFFFALASIGYSGYKTEKKTSENSNSVITKLEQIDNRIIQNEKTINNSIKIKNRQILDLRAENQLLMDSLKTCNMNNSTDGNEHNRNKKVTGKK